MEIMTRHEMQQMFEEAGVKFEWLEQGQIPKRGKLYFTCKNYQFVSNSVDRTTVIQDVTQQLRATRLVRKHDTVYAYTPHMIPSDDGTSTLFIFGGCFVLDNKTVH